MVTGVVNMVMMKMVDLEEDGDKCPEMVYLSMDADDEGYQY